MTAQFTRNRQTGAFDVITTDVNVKRGDTITVTKKNGTETIVLIDYVGREFVGRFGAFAGVPTVICRTRAANRRAANRTRCRECGGAVVDAPHHAATAGYCGNCAFDEFDC